MQTTAVSSTIIGTDAYMAPEAFDGKRSVQTDIWSVGVVLYQLLKGSLPFPQDHPSERMFAVLTKEFEPLDDDVPASLRAIVARALQKQPENRYGSTTEMRDDLQRALIAIAHPTLAQTEVLHVRPADLPAVAMEPVEAETVVRAASPVTTPPAQEPSHSVATQVKITPGPVAASGDESLWSHLIENHSAAIGLLGLGWLAVILIAASLKVAGLGTILLFWSPGS